MTGVQTCALPISLVLPLEADVDDLRAEVGSPGRYRVDPVDETNKPIANTPAGYPPLPSRRSRRWHRSRRRRSSAATFGVLADAEPPTLRLAASETQIDGNTEGSTSSIAEVPRWRNLNGRVKIGSNLRTGSKWVTEPTLFLRGMRAVRKPLHQSSQQVVVPRDGVEPPTRGFSVRCSTN